MSLPRPFAVISSVVIVILIVICSSACSADRGAESGEWVAEYDTVGDTIVVRTISGSVWGEPREMELVLSIGMLDGAEELMFGSVRQMAVDEEGGIYAFDGQVPALRYFDAEGNYVRTLGREGAGPGEYQGFVSGLALRRDGKIVLLNPQNTRINVYEPDGTHFTQWPVQGGFFSPGLVLDTTDHNYVQVLTGTFASDQPLPTGFLHLSPEGETIDTVFPPRFPNEPSISRLSVFGPSKVMGFSPLGYLIVGMNGDYRFDIRSLDGPVVRVEREYEPVALLAEEKADWQAIYDWFEENRPFGEVGSVPDHKPPYSEFLATQDGRVWVQRRTEGYKEEDEEPAPEDSNRPPPVNWEEPAIYDVFELDGTYLGEVRFPLRTEPLFIRADTAWGVYRGEFDEQYVVRMVISQEAPGATD
jgi:hypothetical protein